MLPLTAVIHTSEFDRVFADRPVEKAGLLASEKEEEAQIRIKFESAPSDPKDR